MLEWGRYVQAHDADDRRRVITPLRGLDHLHAHAACFQMNEMCERYPETADELIRRWEETDLTIDDDEETPA